MMKWACLALALAATGCVSSLPKDEVVKDEVRQIAAPVPAPELVAIDVSIDRAHVRADSASTLYARVRIDGATIRRKKRPAVNIALVLDTSASMQGDAIVRAREAGLTMLEALADGDRLSVVTFDSEARVLVPSTVLDAAAKKHIRAAIEAITAQGSTELAAGLQQGLAQVQGQLRPDGINRIVLVGDGIPNDPAPLAALAAHAAQHKISITSLGLGLDYDETLMGKLAQSTGGSFHFVEDPAEVAGVLRSEVLDLEQLVAHNLMVDILPGPGVSVVEVIGLPSTPNGRAVRVPVGELHEEESRDVIVKLQVPARAAGATVELADVSVSYQDATVGAGQLGDKTFVSVAASADPEVLAQPADRDVVLSIARAEVAGLVLAAIEAARGGNLQQANALIDKAEQLAQHKAAELDDATLRDKAKGMAELKKSLPSLQQATVATPPPRPHPPAGPSAPAQPMVPSEAPSIVRGAHEAAMRDLR